MDQFVQQIFSVVGGRLSVLALDESAELRKRVKTCAINSERILLSWFHTSLYFTTQ